jgi:hypothetical protein
MAVAFAVRHLLRRVAEVTGYTTQQMRVDPRCADCAEAAVVLARLLTARLGVADVVSLRPPSRQLLALVGSDYQSVGSAWQVFMAITHAIHEQALDERG